MSPTPQARAVMVKDEDVCLHCGLCADAVPLAPVDSKNISSLYLAGNSCPVQKPIAA